MRVLAVDQGTSGTKALVVDDGVVVASADSPVRPHYLADGRVEQDPDELLASVLDAGERAVQRAGGGIDAVALANQGETVLAWDPESGRPLSVALVWQDGQVTQTTTVGWRDIEAGLPIAVAQFTNFTQDHLDYHRDMDAYWACKRALQFGGQRRTVFVVDVDHRGAQAGPVEQPALGRFIGFHAAVIVEVVAGEIGK